MPDARTFMAVPRANGEELRLSLSEYQGRSFGNLRLYFQTSDGQWRPTKHGVSLPLRHLGTLREALAAMEAHACAERLIEEPRGANLRTVQ